MVTFKSGSLKTQIDFLKMRADSRRSCKDCKVILSEYLGTQHRLLVLDVEFKCSKGKKRRVRTLELNGAPSRVRTSSYYQRGLLKKELGGGQRMQIKCGRQWQIVFEGWLGKSEALLEEVVTR